MAKNSSSDAGVEFAASPPPAEDNNTGGGTTDGGSTPDSKLEDRAFFNAQDGVTGRDGGPYLDQVERVNAEQVRAFREGREVRSFNELLNEKLPASVGTDLRIAALVPDNRLTSNPSMAQTAGLEQAITDSTFTENKDLADPISVLQVDVAGQDATGSTFGSGQVDTSHADEGVRDVSRDARNTDGGLL